jgi:DNA-binding NarL/FixJ family response regulator
MDRERDGQGHLGRTEDDDAVERYFLTRGNNVPSKRELDVLSCISNGMTYEMAAETLGVGAQTIQTHLKTVRARLKAKNTTHACCIAIRNGLLA